jgi:hypothetical protein
VGASGNGQGGYRDCAGYALPFIVGNQLRKLYSVMNVYVAAPDHPIHQEPSRCLK